MSSTTRASPFATVVVDAMRKLYPEALADKSFDNTGLLLEAPYRPGQLRPSALLTIDLTKAVADEAIRRKDSIIVTYHPIIFRGLKSLTLADTQQTTLLRLAQEGISVYSPHTAVDAAPAGLGDFLSSILLNPLQGTSEYTVTPITPLSSPPSGFESSGYGRILRFNTPVPLSDLIIRITEAIGTSGLSVAVPQSVPASEKANIMISSVGICAGSGESLFKGLDVDLLFTGELSHHDALAAIEQGRCVITTFHSNSERAFLAKRMQPALTEELERRVEQEEMDEMMDREVGGLPGGFEVKVSEEDRDPFEIVVRGQTGWFEVL